MQLYTVTIVQTYIIYYYKRFKRSLNNLDMWCKQAKESSLLYMFSYSLFYETSTQQ